jgi:hypothetical protein
MLPELLLRGPGHDVGQVFPDLFVGLPLDLAQLFLRDRAGEVDRDHVRAHVEAHVVPAEGRVHEPLTDVLAAVLLHEIEAPLPVDLARDLRALRQGSLAPVDDPALPLVRVSHAHAAERARVAGLAAALGVKSGPVQLHVPAVPAQGGRRAPAPQNGADGSPRNRVFRSPCHVPPVSAFSSILAQAAAKRNRFSGFFAAAFPRAERRFFVDKRFQMS